MTTPASRTPARQHRWRWLLAVWLVCAVLAAGCGSQVTGSQGGDAQVDAKADGNVSDGDLTADGDTSSGASDSDTLQTGDGGTEDGSDDGSDDGVAVDDATDGAATDAADDGDQAEAGSDADDGDSQDSADTGGAGDVDDADVDETSVAGDADTAADADGDADVNADADAESDADAEADTTDPLDVLPDAATIVVVSFDATVAPAQVAGPQLDLLSLPPAAFLPITSTFGFGSKSEWLTCVAVGDTDADGDDDVVLMRRLPDQTVQIVTLVVQAGAPPSVVTSKVDTSLLVPTDSCALVDMDADGDGDLWLGGASGLGYYKNVGSSSFVDDSAAVLPPLLLAQPTSMAPTDLDLDGDLDLFVAAGSPPTDCNQMSCAYSNADFQCVFKQTQALNIAAQDLVLRNDNGVFSDVTSQWGVPNLSPNMSTAADLDLDLDGKPDILVGNDFGPQEVLRNTGKSFEVQSKASGINVYGHAMGWGVGDLDGDGWIDLVQTDLGPSHVWRRVPPAANAAPGTPPSFVDVAGPWGLMALTWATSTWNPLFHDFDNDGDLDILLGVSVFQISSTEFAKKLNGCGQLDDSFVGVDLLLRNDLSTGGGFAAARLPTETGCADVAHLPQALVDLDGDGDLDVLQVRPACIMPFGRLRILRNDLTVNAPAVRLRLQGKGANRQAIGARLTATLAGKPIVRVVAGGKASGGNGTRVLHVGLGASKVLHDVKIHWPDGSVSKLGTVAPGGVQVVLQP